MNILSIVSTLLILFSITTAFVIDRHAKQKIEQTSMQAYCQAQRNLLNKTQDGSFKNTPKKKIPTTENAQTALKEKGKKEQKNAKQENEPPIERKVLPCGLINLHPLFLEGKENHPYLLKAFGNLLDLLYKDCAFYEEMKSKNKGILLAERISKEGFDILHKEKQKVFIEKLKVGEDLQYVFYKMLKGSSPSAQKPYPSFLDFLIFSEELNDTICIAHAPKEILLTLLPAKIVEGIDEYLQKNSSLNEAAMENIYKNAGQIFNPKDPLWQFLAISHKKNKKNGRIVVREKDDNGLIEMQKTIFVEKNV